jgi:antitoxin CptB
MDAAALQRMRWRARRGLLENDLLLTRFLDRHGATLDEARSGALTRLLELPDNDLLDLLLGRTELPHGQADPATADLLRALRAL